MDKLLFHLEKLQAFSTIADARSVQAAARQLHTSQPALSLKLRTLEEALGARLFTRSKKGVELTTAGHALYQFSRRMLADATRLSRQLRGEPEGLRIGSFDVIINMIARKLAAPGAFNDLHLRIERSSLSLLAALESGELDLVVVDDPPTIPGLTYRKLVASPFGLFAAKPLAAKLRNHAAAMRAAPLIFVPGTLAFAHVAGVKKGQKLLIDSFLEPLGVGGGKVIRVDSHATCIEITAQGQGIGLLLVGHVLDRLESGTLKAITPIGASVPMSSDLYVVTRASKGDPQVAAAVDAIETVFKEAVASYLGCC